MVSDCAVDHIPVSLKSFSGYNTGVGASLQKLPDKSQISGKRCWKLRKKKVKSNFSETTQVSRLARVLSTIRAGWARAAEKMFRGNDQELAKRDIRRYWYHT